MLNINPLKMTKWKPKDDLIGVPGKGYIKAADFKEEDLQNLIKRAKNRKKDVHSFLLNCGLVPDSAQIELEIDPVKKPEPLKTEVIADKPKAPVKPKRAIE